MIRRLVLWFDSYKDMIGVSIAIGIVGCVVIAVFGWGLSHPIYNTDNPTIRQAVTVSFGLAAGLGFLAGLGWLITIGYSRLVHWAELPARVAEDLEGKGT